MRMPSNDCHKIHSFLLFLYQPVLIEQIVFNYGFRILIVSIRMGTQNDTNQIVGVV